MIDNIRIFDAHMHILGRFKPRDEPLVDYMSRFKIDRAIVTTVNEQTSLNALLNNQNNNLEYMQMFAAKSQYDHIQVLNAVRKHPERLTGFFWFNPRIANEDDWRLLERYIHEYNFKGVKIQPYVDMLKVPDHLHELAEFCIDADIPLFLHSGSGFFFQQSVRAKNYHRLVKKHKDLKVIIGHAAFTMEYCINCLRYFLKTPNVYFETSVSIPYGIMTLIKAMGADRVLYGSDAPTATPPDVEIAKIKLFKFDEKIQQKVFFDNLVRLIGER